MEFFCYKLSIKKISEQKIVPCYSGILRPDWSLVRRKIKVFLKFEILVKKWKNTWKIWLSRWIAGLICHHRSGRYRNVLLMKSHFLCNSWFPVRVHQSWLRDGIFSESRSRNPWETRSRGFFKSLSRFSFGIWRDFVESQPETNQMPVCSGQCGSPIRLTRQSLSKLIRHEWDSSKLKNSFLLLLLILLYVQ